MYRKEPMRMVGGNRKEAIRLPHPLIGTVALDDAFYSSPESYC